MDTYSFMEKRKAFNLKWLLAAYNILQVATCCYIIYGFLSNELSIIKFWKCQSVDYKSNRKANSLVIYSYQTFLLKLVELIETVFFVLRKKQNQVSKLHVYHHVSTAILAWCVVKYAAGQHLNHYNHKKVYDFPVLHPGYLNFISFCICFALFCCDRWYGAIFRGSQLICTCHHVQLLLCRFVWTGRTTQIGRH